MINKVNNIYNNLNKGEDKKVEYVSDIITPELIEKFGSGFTLRLKAGAGKGKSYWVGEVLGKLAKKKNQRILMVVHRIPLLRDMEELFGSMEGLEDTIFTTTYQSIATQVMKGKDMFSDLSRYDYIVYDEFQFVFNDSSFNSLTEINVNLIKGLQGTTSQILVSANSFPQVVNYNFVVDLSEENVGEYDISERVNKSVLINSEQHINHIIDSVIERDEKIAVFINSTNDIEKLYNRYKDECVVYVSENNRLSHLMDEEEKQLIAEEGKFSKKILLATGVMDSGVSLKMKDLKHILVKERSIGAAYQFIGRKRMLDENDKFNLYLCDFHNNQLGGFITPIINKLNLVDDFIEDREAFYQLHGRSQQDNHLFYTDHLGMLQLNEIRVKMLTMEYIELADMLDTGYGDYMRKGLNLPLIDLMKMEKVNERDAALEKLVDVDLLQVKDRKVLIETLNVRINSKLSRNIETLNSALQEENLPFRIVQSKKNFMVDGEYKRFSAVWTLKKFK